MLIKTIIYLKTDYLKLTQNNKPYNKNVQIQTMYENLVNK